MATPRILCAPRLFLAAAIMAVAATAEPTAAQTPVPLQGEVILKTAVATFAGPTGVRATSSPLSIRLTWVCPAGATGYEVYGTPRGGGTIRLNQTPIGSQCYQDLALSINPDPRLPAPSPSYISSFTHQGLAPGMEFGYVVRALYPTGYGDSGLLMVTASLWPAPTGFVASLAGRSAALRWGQVSGVSGYLVFRRTEGQRGFQQIATQPAGATTFNDTMILPPGQHAYYVQGVQGEPTAAATLEPGPWPAPGNFGLTIADRTASLSWGPIPGGPGFLIFKQAPGQASFQQLTPAPIATLAYQESALTLGTHRYYVQAVGGQASPALSVIAGRPTGVDVAIYPGKGTVDFKWTGTANADVIALMRAPSPAGPYTDVTRKGNVARNEWARDDRATVGATQYYKIVAVYLASGPMESEVLTATIPVGPQGITNLRAVSNSPGTATISWTCDPQATGYGALRGKVGSPNDWIPFTMTKPCEFTDTNLWNGATYNYVITGKYADRNTSTSAGVSVTIAP